MAKRLRVLAVVLAVACVLPFSACGKKKSGKSNEKDTPTVVKEDDPFFNAEIKELKLPIDPGRKLDTQYVSSCRLIGDVVLVEYNVNYDEDEDYDPDSVAESMAHGQAIYDLSGNLIHEMKAGNWENTVAATIDKAGDLYFLVSVPNDHFEYTTKLRKVKDGKSEDVMDVPGSVSGSGMNTSVQILDDGNFAINLGSGITIYSKEGEKICTISDPGRIVSMNVYQVEGKNYILSRNSSFDEAADSQFKEVDLKTGKLGQGKSAPLMGHGTSLTCNDNKLYAFKGSKVIRYDIGSGSSETVFDWNDTDVDMWLVKNASCLPKNDNEYYAAFSERIDGFSSRACLVSLKRAEKNPNAGKTIITVGMPTLMAECSKCICSYNSDMTKKSRIRTIDYKEQLLLDGKDPDETTAEEYVRKEFLAGRVPDILVGFDSVGGFKSDNLMVDLVPYIDSENGLDRSLFYDNIFRAMEKDGKLFFAPLTFSVETLMVNDKFIPENAPWTYKGFLETGRSVPDGVSFYPSKLKGRLLGDMLRTTKAEFLDYEKKTVHFDNDDFYTLLDIAKEFGLDKIPDEEQMKVTYLDDGTAISEGTFITPEDKFKEEIIAVREAYVVSMLTYGMEKSFLKNHASYRGYPGKNGGGNAVMCITSMGITADSKNKDEAWNVIKSFYEKESQIDLCAIYGLPMRRESFRAVCEKEMNAIQANRARMIEESGGYEDPSLDDFAPDIQPKDIDDVEKLILSIDRSFEGDGAIEDIVMEEAGGYFSGSRSKEDTAKNINNRGNILMKERG